MFEKIINKEYEGYSKLSQDKKVFYLETRKSIHRVQRSFFIYPVMVGIFGALIYPMMGFILFILASILSIIGTVILSYKKTKHLYSS